MVDTVEKWIENGNAFVADTLEELVEKIGVPAENLTATVARYNEIVASGDDTDFGKRAEALIPVDEPPYYACSGAVGNAGASVTMVTMSGVITDNRLNVVALNGNPIKGLYTCGNSLGGRYGTGYCTPCAGSSIGMAGTHGRLAGQFVVDDN